MISVEKLLTGLNDPQRKAVDTLDGPLLVLAGAGTGKTKVLTTRLAHILLSGKAKPNEILAVTFTNKAAKEMAHRVEDIVGSNTAGMWLGTFHSIAARMLRMYAERVNLRPDFTILDTDDQKRLIAQIIEDRNLDATRFPARLIISVISRWKDNGWRPQDLPAEEADNIGGMGQAIYVDYQRRLEALNAVDFGDLLLKVMILFKENKDVLERFQGQLKYVLVDEYQDTNAVQYLWLRLMTMTHKNICVVGDDDQSIYAWRGAQVGNILKFEQDFPGAVVVRLEQNYRSTGHILQAASHLIAHNSERHKKTLWTDVGHGEKIYLHACMDDREESRFISDAIEHNTREGKRYEDHAVLVRTAAQTRSFEEQFIRSGVPYIVVGGLRFYERKEIRDAIAYLRLINNNDDDLALQRIINVPKRGIGKATIETLTYIARSNGCSLMNAVNIAVDEQQISGKTYKTLANFAENITTWRHKLTSTTPDRLMENVLEQAGYLDMLRADKDPEAKARIDNLKELIRAMQDYADVPSFLEHVALVMDEEAQLDDAVRVMTIHAAKGLEFNHVFLPGFEEGIFPHQRSLNEEGGKGLEEERRLAYVAITRARKRLDISYTSARRLYGQFTPSTASRFLSEIPGECVEVVASATAGSAGYAARPQWGSRIDKRAVGDYARPAEPLVAYSSSTPPQTVTGQPLGSAGDYAIGERVFHQKFGYGRIQKSEGAGDAQRLTIAFEKAGPKTLVAALAKLERQ